MFKVVKEISDQQVSQEDDDSTMQRNRQAIDYTESYRTCWFLSQEQSAAFKVFVHGRDLIRNAFLKDSWRKRTRDGQEQLLECHSSDNYRNLEGNFGSLNQNNGVYTSEYKQIEEIIAMLN